MAVVIVLLTAVACSSGPTGSTEKQKSDSATARSRPIAVQFVVDAGFLDSASLGPGILSDQGVVQTNGSFQEFYVPVGGGHPFGDSPRSLVRDEATRLIPLIRQVARLQSDADNSAHVATLTADEAARLIVVQELVDSGALDPNAVGAPAAGTAVLSPGPAIDTWFTAHSNSPLRVNAKVTVAQEAARVSGFITMAEPPLV